MTGRPQQDEQPKTPGNVLVLIRHGESEWNRLNRFTGSKDVGLTEEGLFEAHRAGAMLEAEGYKTLKEGGGVGLEIVRGKKGPQADKVRKANSHA